MVDFVRIVPFFVDAAANLKVTGAVTRVRQGRQSISLIFEELHLLPAHCAFEQGYEAYLILHDAPNVQVFIDSIH